MKQLNAHVTMLIRRPMHEVFAAIVDPAKITQFWLARTSGPLAPGARVRWDFMVEGAHADCEVTAFEQDRCITIRWSDGSDVEFLFDRHESGGTVVEIKNSGFTGGENEIIAAALESTQGFTIVLCDLKTLLEQGVSMSLARDKAALIQSRQHKS